MLHFIKGKIVPILFFRFLFLKRERERERERERKKTKKKNCNEKRAYPVCSGQTYVF